MVNLNTKDDKHAIDNERRRKSIKEKEKAKLNQSNIIKQALSGSLNNSSSKKIVFNDDTGDFNNFNSHSKNGKMLFDGSDSEDENFKIEEKIQFDGKKGLELLNLQSTYGNDERFKIDERFLDNEAEDVFKVNEEKSNNAENEVEDEKTRQLKILASVLGESASIPDTEKKKGKKRTFEMVRYDVLNKDHEKYEMKSEIHQAKKARQSKQLQKAATNSTPKPEVSKEKFYEVSNNIKASLKDNKEQSNSFSILQTYGQNNNSTITNDDYDENLGEECESVKSGKSIESFCQKSKFKENGIDFSEEPKVSRRSSAVKGIWKESFFFVPDDPRFKEGLEFINKKNSDEAYEAAENYDKTRRKLKEILRLHMKKQLHRKDPFKTKIGGMNKKQLANLKSKNAKNFNRRKFT